MLRAARSNPGRDRPRADAAQPLRGALAGLLCEDREHRRRRARTSRPPTSSIRAGCSSALAASTSRSTPPSARIPTSAAAPWPPAARRRSSRTPWCTTPCSRAGRRPRSGTPPRDRSPWAPTSGHPRCARTCRSACSTNSSHPLLLAAGAGLLTRRAPVAALLSIPYALHLRRRLRAVGAAAACAVLPALRRNPALGDPARRPAPSHVHRLSRRERRLPFRRGVDPEWLGMETRSSRWQCAPYEVSAALRLERRSRSRPRWRPCWLAAASWTRTRPLAS